VPRDRRQLGQVAAACRLRTGRSTAARTKLKNIDLRGYRVLDVGTMDGLIRFIAEGVEGAGGFRDRYFRPSFLFAHLV
jgi:hypothetical protein